MSWGWSNTPSELTPLRAEPCSSRISTRARSWILPECPRLTHRPGVLPFQRTFLGEASNESSLRKVGSALVVWPGVSDGRYSHCMSFSSLPIRRSRCDGVRARSSIKLSSTRCQSWQSRPCSHGSSFDRICCLPCGFSGGLPGSTGGVVSLVALRRSAKRRTTPPVRCVSYTPVLFL